MLRIAAEPIALEDLGAVRVRGADAVRFLQGQVSQNVERLSPERSLLAGFHNAQGRVIALLRLVWLAENDILAVLPRELASPVAARLAKFVLRAKVTVEDESSTWDVQGFIGDGADLSDAQATSGDRRLVRVGESPARWLCIAPHDASAARSPVPEAALSWHRYEIASGEPQVFAATSETFVAQMLNLDVLDAVAFDKGCYTGQEIIARTHYRGRMKRRMQRFRAVGSPALAPGDRGRFEDGRGFIVVRAARTGDTVDFLAVTSHPGGDSEPSEAAPGTSAIHAAQQPMPYALPT